MAAPFVVSMKIVGDATSGVAAVNAERQALEMLALTMRGVAGAGAQQNIDSMLGIGASGRSASAAAGDIAVYGNELDRLRAKFNPLYAVIRQYREAVLEARQANSVGAISSNELTAAIDRERTAALASIAALKGRAQAQRGGGTGAFQTANIAAQFQDIGVTAAMGMDPLQIALQQGTQLAAILGPMGATGVVKGLGAAFASLVSPVSLLTIGLIAAGVAGAQWLMSMIPKVKSADEVIKGHEALIRGIKDAYGDAADGLDKYLEHSNTLLSAQARQNLTLVQAQARQSNDALVQTVGGDLAPDAVFHKNGVLVDYLVRQQYKPFSDAIMALRQQVKAGAPDFDQFYASVNAKVTADSSLRGVADQLIITTAETAKWNQTLEQAGRAAAVVQGIVASISQGTAGNVLQGSFDALDASRSQQQSVLDLAAIGARSPAQVAEIARRQKLIELGDQNLTMSRQQQEADQAYALAYAQSAHGVAEADRSRLLAANQNIASAQLGLDVIGKSVAETERLQFVQQQLASAEAAAAQSGTTVSAAYRAQIEALGAAYGKLQANIAISKLRDDLGFARDQLGRSAIDQQVASTLRPIFGDDLSSDQAQFLAQQIKVNQALTDFNTTGRDITGGFLSDLRSDLMSGASLFGALGDAGANALDKIASKAEDALADGLWNMIFGALTGSAGFGGGSSFGNVGSFSIGNMPSYATGTSSHPGGLAQVNEKGGEIIDLPSGSRVYPHDVSMQMAANSAGAATIHFAPTITIDATNSNLTESQIRSIVDEANNRTLEKLPAVVNEVLRHPRRF